MCSSVEHPLRGVEVDPAVVGQRADVDFATGELPRDDVRVMLELGQQHAVAVAAREGAGDEIDRFGRAAGEDDFVASCPPMSFGGRGRAAS